MVLEKVNDDTGIDRERVMEKLSDATLAMKRHQSEGRTPVRKHVKVRKAVHRSRSDGESSVDHPDTTPTVRHRLLRVAPLPNRPVLLSHLHQEAWTVAMTKSRHCTWRHWVATLLHCPPPSPP